jgi:hypothetical protein
MQSTTVAHYPGGGDMQHDVYFLTVRACPPGLLLRVPAGGLAAAVITHARSFLHPDLPQPDGGRVYRCLTEAPGRAPGCLVPLSDLDYELCGGHLWPQVADRDRLLDALSALIAAGRCDSLSLPLIPWDDKLLNGGPYSHVPLMKTSGGICTAVTAEGTTERAAILASLTVMIRARNAGCIWWPGDGLIQPQPEPANMPYQPYGT